MDKDKDLLKKTIKMKVLPMDFDPQDLISIYSIYKEMITEDDTELPDDTKSNLEGETNE